MSINVKVGSANHIKLDAITIAFEHYFEDVQVRGYDVESHVPSQPVDDEVYQGAENRLMELKKDLEEYDYLVSCEAGLIYQHGRYFNVQIVLIEDKNGKKGFGLSQGFEIPRKYEQEVINSSIAKMLNRVFEGKGGIRVLSKGQFTRTKLIEDATVMALARVLNGEIW